ncbi:hypothetical protein [Deinococcus humi]|uniref:Uncharacterized protein n=1 Tax=Deinococcus humi TaxID=662880 RepID=A0A7W8JWA5_9DEIO|nr:hypothetical protein [Deinococcus humi]MBB5363123.1 hypothetical protein [Deinococcus humi]GGO24563.1 hypothetical protein GCM10008949_13620 [Deinococcus humi]
MNSRAAQATLIGLGASGEREGRADRRAGASVASDHQPILIDSKWLKRKPVASKTELIETNEAAPIMNISAAVMTLFLSSFWTWYKRFQGTSQRGYLGVKLIHTKTGCCSAWITSDPPPFVTGVNHASEVPLWESGCSGASELSF